MNGRLRLPAAGLLALLLVTVCAAPAHAQTLPDVPGPNLGALIEDPSKWATDLFNAALVGLGRRTTDPLVQAVTGVLRSSDVISQTPPRLSYDSDAVKQ